MKTKPLAVSLGLLAFLLLAPLPAPGVGIEKTVHNLSATGPGAIKVPGVGELCIFCHTPHNANPSRALWNRQLPGVTYELYKSTTLEATLNQSTGASRLCLSCHDGTLALGALRVQPKGKPVTLGPLQGRASLGTDLSDDHPVSFVYDSALALKRGQLADPKTLPKVVKLDETRQLQCTSCHDPHEDKYGHFLVLENRSSRLCTACHQVRNWPGSSHAISPATWKGIHDNPWPDSAWTTVAENGCQSCHRSHAAGRRERLLRSAKEEENCFICHNGAVAARDVEQEFKKLSAHPIDRTEWVHDPKEDPAFMQRHVTCVDCHSPHGVRSARSSPPTASGSLRGVKGVSLSGATVQEAAFEYEVCFTCHGVSEQPSVFVFRDDTATNLRLRLDPSNPSFHPVAAAGRNPNIAGLESPYTPSSFIFCTDCHNSDGAAAPGTTRPRGAHGSRFEPILEREYQMVDPSPESFQSYALCYKCHNRPSLLGDQGGFSHRRHVVEGRISCVICHDAHGSRRNPALIDFALRLKTGQPVVARSKSGRLEFRAFGRGRGECTLSCHGVDHDPETYP